ncbi:endonuclease III [Halobellus salinus]|uniref:Endonuclease III n=1 Tax=Halobellus salinus TaxID=931585 RepID=A0A830E8A2_9EURY|nr:endonuclease III [Halobellus salinus]GGI99088.1 endonuclease III [Halobellus salinus]SMP05091.1 endonuclease-3 [Halobellus salinus]
MPDEPRENIAGDTDTAPAAFEPGTTGTRAEAVVDDFGGLYWQKTYGGTDAFESLVRTILSQNTSDVASQPAHDALMERYGGDGLAAALADAERARLAETISSAGLYNQKSEVIVDAAARIREAYGGADAFDEFVREDEPGEVRDALLDIHGVGPKTADCVLLFAGGRDGVFPVDTHVHRIARRMGLAPADAGHEEVRSRLEADVPAEKCGFGHTAMIQFGREYCTARKPACLDGPEACPLYGRCDRVGVDEVGESVVDPAEAAGD